MPEQNVHLPQETPVQPAMLTVNDVATLLACSSRTIYRLADNSRIPPPVRLGAMVRWPCEAIDTWIAAGCPICHNSRR